MKRIEDLGFKIVVGLSITFSVITAVALVVGTLFAPQRLDRGSDRFDRIEKHQHELSDRIDALSSSLRATVRPIGWDVPRDGGVR